MMLAAIDLDALIPLIVGLFWVVAQVAGAAAKKKKPAPPAPSRLMPDSDNGDDAPEAPPALNEIDGFAELMRKLSGVQEFKISQPPEPEAVPIRSVRPDGPAPEPAGRMMPPAEPIRPEPLSVPEVDIRPTMSAFKTAMPSMKLPAMSLSFQTSEKSGSGFPKVGKIIDPADQQTLRRAILGHIILGKPKALEGWNTGRID